MKNQEKRKTPRGQKTRMIKQRETHVIMAIDSIDRCLQALDSDPNNTRLHKHLLVTARKEVSKI